MPSEPSYRDILQDTLALLREIEAHYSPATLSNGFGPESMVLTDLIVRHDLTIHGGYYGTVPGHARGGSRSVLAPAKDAAANQGA